MVIDNYVAAYATKARQKNRHYKSASRQLFSGKGSLKRLLTPLTSRFHAHFSNLMCTHHRSKRLCAFNVLPETVFYISVLI